MNGSIHNIIDQVRSIHYWQKSTKITNLNLESFGLFIEKQRASIKPKEIITRELQSSFRAWIFISITKSLNRCFNDNPNRRFELRFLGFRVIRVSFVNGKNGLQYGIINRWGRRIRRNPWKKGENWLKKWGNRCNRWFDWKSEGVVAIVGFVCVYAFLCFDFWTCCFYFIFY
jgi:hypothetical protein